MLRVDTDPLKFDRISHQEITLDAASSKDSMSEPGSGGEEAADYGSIGDEEDARVWIISVPLVKRSTSMDLQNGNSKSDVQEYDNEIAQFMASSYKQHGGGTNDPSLCELDEYDLYEGYDNVVSDFTGKQNCFL
ncbi:hypothetical protein Tco_1564359 [Tanacetum coccineum]